MVEVPENWKIETAAHAAHEANRAYCRSLGDVSQAPWDDAPEWQKSSARDGVVAVMTNSSITPEQSHEGWMKQKIADGWHHGSVKDADAKTHPCLVPFEELPFEQQAKDKLFTNVVKATLAVLATHPV
jgi:hypothetical protein